jgi:hypothetical protein
MSEPMIEVEGLMLRKNHEFAGIQTNPDKILL